MFLQPGSLNYLKVKLFGVGEYYNMSYAKTDKCSHNCAYVKEIYNRENIPINYSDIKDTSAVPVATEYLTLGCTDCSESWNGKRIILEHVEIKIGKENIGTTGRLPKTFIEIKPSECEHLSFSIDNNTIEYIEPQNYYNKDNEKNENQLWAYSKAECRHCKSKLYAKRKYVKEQMFGQTVNEILADPKWTICKMSLQ